MKRLITSIWGASAAVALLGSVAIAQEVTTTTTETTTVSGTVTEFVPARNVISIRTETAPEPVEYHWTEKTTIVGPGGKVITDRAILRSGVPATIHYSTVGDRRVVDRVVLSELPAGVEGEVRTETEVEVD